MTGREFTDGDRQRESGNQDDESRHRCRVGREGKDARAEHTGQEARHECRDRLEHVSQCLPARADGRDQSGRESDEDSRQDLVPAPAQEAGHRARRQGKGERGDDRTEERWRGLDVIESLDAGLGRDAAAQDIGGDPVELRHLAQAHASGIHPHEVGALFPDGAEGRHDGCGSREDLRVWDAQSSGEADHDLLDAAGREAMAVQCPPEAEHELHGTG